MASSVAAAGPARRGRVPERAAAAPPGRASGCRPGKAAAFKGVFQVVQRHGFDVGQTAEPAKL